jgi:hypothetical protein
MSLRISIVVVLFSALAAGCSTVNKNIEFNAASPDALVLVTGVDLGGNNAGSLLTGNLLGSRGQTGVVFRAFDPVDKNFTADVFRINDDGFSSDEVKIKDADGESVLTRSYYLKKTKVGLFVPTTDIRNTTAFVEGSAISASALYCRKSGYAFPILPGKVNVINLTDPAPDEAAIAAYRRDFAKIHPDFPNLQAELHVPVPVGFVEFYGDTTGSLAILDLNACPRGVSNYTEDLDAARADDSGGKFIILEE